MFRSRESGGYSIAVCALALAAGCSPVDNPTLADPASALSEPVFRCSVEPILARQCSFNACHGIATAALRVYTPGKLRKTPPLIIDDLIAPLTEAEQHDNFESAAGFSLGVAPDDNFLIRKPLPASDGGFEHKGGAIYTGLADKQVVAIHDWLGGTGKCP